MKTIFLIILTIGLVAQVSAQTDPVISPIGDTTIYEGTVLEWHITATDIDGDPLSFRMTPSLDTLDRFGGQAVFVDSANGAASFVFSPGYDGFYGGYLPFSFIVEDGTGRSDSIEVHLVVIDVNARPIWDPIGDQTITEGQILSLLISSLASMLNSASTIFTMGMESSSSNHPTHRPECMKSIL